MVGKRETNVIRQLPNWLLSCNYRCFLENDPETKPRIFTFFVSIGLMPDDRTAI